MKRLLILILSFCLLVACSFQQDRKFVVGVSQCSDDLWRETANREMLREVSFDSSISLEIRTARDNSQEQIKDVEYFIEKGVDLLIVSPNESAVLTPVVSKAFRSGIPVILFDRKIDSEDYSTYVGADNIQIGEQIGHYLSDLARKQELNEFEIIILRGTSGATADSERYLGLMKSMGEMDGVTIHIIDEVFADFTRHDAYEAMSQIIRLYGLPESLDAIIAFNDEMAIGAHEAIAELLPGVTQPPIVGVDALSGEDGGIAAIQNGIISASFIYPTGGDVVINVARNILNRSAFDRDYILNTALVNIDNVRVLSLQRDEIEAKQSKLEEISMRLENITDISNFQKRTAMILTVLICLIFVFLLILLSLNRRRAKMNEVLNEQNIKINEQVQKLEAQNNQLVNLTKQLEDATQAKLVFFTNVSHEFRTPLTLILGSIDLLLESQDLSSEHKRSLLMIKRNSGKLLSLINEILDLRTYENNQMKVNYSRVNLKTFLEDINTMFMDIVRVKCVNFNFFAQAGTFDILMDRNKLEKIYFNILSNAFKYVKEGGSVRVYLSADEGESKAIISVFNSDSFIPEDMRNEIFKRFYKIDPLDSNSSGIGLALAMSLADALGGSISVDSDMATGTTFTVTLPYKQSDSSIPITEYDYQFVKQSIAVNKPVVNPEIHLEAIGHNINGTVLVIEDSPDMLEYIGTILGPEYKVIQAANGKEGVDKAAHYIPDLVISDIMMPIMDGYEVCRMLKSSAQTKNIPIILLTACTLDDQRALGYDVGADAFIQKPFSASVLKTRIRNLMAKKNAILESSGYNWLVGTDKAIPSQGCDILDKIVQYVTEHIDESITLDNLTMAAGTSKANLYKKIKEATDYNPIDLVNLLKIRKAIDLVVYKHKNLTEAAYELGFSSLSYFSRTFSKYYKDSPTNWIKEHYGDRMK